MFHRRFRQPLKAAVALLSIASFLPFSLLAATGAMAADAATFETWPKKTAEAGVDTAQIKDAAAEAGTFETWPKKTAEPVVGPGPAKAGEAAGAKTSSGISAGTWGWIAGGAAAAILIGVIALGSNGGGGGTSTTPNH